MTVTEQRLLLLALRVVVAQMPRKERNQIRALAKQIRTVIRGHGDAGRIAVGLVTSEENAKDPS